MVFPALKPGAPGYLLKHSVPEDVLHAISQAYCGETVLLPAIARMVQQELHGWWRCRFRRSRLCRG